LENIRLWYNYTKTALDYCEPKYPTTYVWQEEILFYPVQTALWLYKEIKALGGLKVKQKIVMPLKDQLPSAKTVRNSWIQKKGGRTANVTELDWNMLDSLKKKTVQFRYPETKYCNTENAFLPADDKETEDGALVANKCGPTYLGISPSYTGSEYLDGALSYHLRVKRVGFFPNGDSYLPLPSETQSQPLVGQKSQEHTQEKERRGNEEVERDSKTGNNWRKGSRGLQELEAQGLRIQNSNKPGQPRQIPEIGLRRKVLPPIPPPAPRRSPRPSPEPSLEEYVLTGQFILVEGDDGTDSRVKKAGAKHDYVHPTIALSKTTFDVDTYLKNFPVTKPGSQYITGDFNSAFLHLPFLPSELRKGIPSLKIVLLLRNPVDRLWCSVISLKRRNMNTPIDDAIQMFMEGNVFGLCPC